LKLFMFPFNIRKQVCDVLDGFLFIINEEWKLKTWHNMLFLMLDLRFKILGWSCVLLINNKIFPS
jgi:hypothetical protein